MSELTIRARTVIKTTNESINLDWSYQKGTPVERVANDITGGRYEQLQATSKELVDVCERLLEAVPYVSDYDVPIGLWDDIKQALANAK